MRTTLMCDWLLNVIQLTPNEDSERKWDVSSFIWNSCDMFWWGDEKSQYGNFLSEQLWNCNVHLNVTMWSFWGLWMVINGLILIELKLKVIKSHKDMLLGCTYDRLRTYLEYNHGKCRKIHKLHKGTHQGPILKFWSSSRIKLKNLVLNTTIWRNWTHDLTPKTKNAPNTQPSTKF